MTSTIAIRRTAILLAIVLTLVGRAADAQGTSRAFPDPMSFDEMSELLEPLAPSTAQRTAIGEAHARYMEGFRTLRAGAMEQYLAEFGSTPLAYSESREQVSEGIDRRRAILREIERHDQRFFAAVDEMITEEQRLALPRLAERRERVRLANSPVAWGWELPTLRRLDLVGEVDKLELTTERRDGIDPILAEYERSLTPAFRKICAQRLELPLAEFDKSRAAIGAFTERMQALQEEFDITTPEGLKEYSAAVTAELQDNPLATPFGGGDLPAQVDIRKTYVRVSRLNRRLLADLRGRLEPEQADRLERRMTQRAYGRIGIPGDPVRAPVDRKLADEETPADLRAAVEQLYAGYRTQRSTLVERVIVAAEEANFKSQSTHLAGFVIGDPNSQPEQPKKDPVAERREELDALNTRTLKALADLTGEEIAPPRSQRFSLPDGASAIVVEGGDGETMTIEIAGDALDAAGGVFVAADASGGIAAIEVVAADAVWVDDSGALPAPGEHADHGGIAVQEFASFGMRNTRGWLPGPMTREDIARLVDDLDLDESIRPVVDALYDEYRAAFDALDEELLAPARTASRAAAQMVFRLTEKEQPEPEEPAEAFGQVRAGMDAIHVVDRRFFEDVALIITDPEGIASLDQASRIRRRDAYMHLGESAMLAGMGSGSREDRIDLIALTMSRKTPLDDDDRATCREFLTDYDTESERLHVERWTVSLGAAERWAEQMYEARRDAGENWMMATHMHEEDSPARVARRRADEAKTRIAELNRRTLARLTPELGATGRAALEDVYSHKAYPTVFRDRERLTGTFDHALDLELPADTSARVANMYLEYRSAYASISDRMVERTREYDASNPASNVFEAAGLESYDHLQALQRDLEAARFERRNLNEHTRQSLVDVLGEENAARVGLGGAG